MDYLPAKEAALLQWATTFGTYITANAVAVGLVAAQATAFNAALTAFHTSYNVTSNRETRSGAAVITKDEKKAALVALARQLVHIVQSFPATTNTQRAEMGITVPRERTPIPPPAFSPTADVKSVTGNSVLLQLHSSTSGTRRGKPEGVSGAQLFSYVGASPPTTAAGWHYEGGITRAGKILVEFDPSLPMGTKAFICAFWTNERNQSGPACAPVEVVLLGGAALPSSQTESLQLAA